MFSMQTGVGGERYQGLSFDAASESDAENDGERVGDGTLEETARQEHEYLRERLRDELGREPSEVELDEWLREHTEGY